MVRSFPFVAGLLSVAVARIVTIHEVVTAAPTTIYESQPLRIITNYETDWISTTIFQATTIVTTIPTGSVNSEITISKKNPVSNLASVSSKQLSHTLNPETYSQSMTIVSIPINTTDNMSIVQPTTSPEVSTSVASTQGQSLESKSSTSTLQSKLNDISDRVGIDESGTTRKSSATSLSQVKSSDTASRSASQVGSIASLSSIRLASSTTKVFTGGISSSSIPSSDISTSGALPSSTAKSVSVSESQSKYTSLSTSGSTLRPTSTPAVKPKYVGPIFDAISKDAPPNIFPRQNLDISMPPGYDSQQKCQTNKFYGNLLLGNYDLTVFTQPYGVFYSKDKQFYGMGVSYTTAKERIFGPDPNANPVEYYTNPLQIKSVVLSAKEFTADNIQIPQVSDMGPFSVKATLRTKGNFPNQKVTYPLAIGSGFVTGIYDGYTPRLFSQIGIKKIVLSQSKHSEDRLQKYVLTLFNNVQWNVYVDGPSGFKFKAVGDHEVMGNMASQDGNPIVVQVAVVVSNENAIDSAAGAYPVSASLEGETDGLTTTYRIAYDVAGKSRIGTTLLYALPHAVASFSTATRGALVPGLTLYSRTKGYLTGVLSNILEMQEDVSDIPGWITGDATVIDPDTLKLLAKTVVSELSQDISSQLDMRSTYSAGKTFDKFSYICLVASEILQADDIALEGLNRLKAAIEPYTQNRQTVNLIYDTLLKGVTSSAGQNGGNPLSDYGSPYYNDHHFHYGYFVHTAAVIGLLDAKVGDGTWVAKNKAWIDSLVRDVANPSPEDPYFPVSRMFDFYSGHSWAHGMFASGDGKDEESTSEDYNFAYGMKLWGRITGNAQMEARGDLMLAVLKRSLISYFLYKDDNSIQPSNFIANRVAGITFENKIDHTTYFGRNLEYIQGIQMIPLTPASVLIREKEFVQQEWNSLLAPIVDRLDSGWAGILRANQAIINPQASYNFFASDNFRQEYLDNGASRSWYIAFAALLKGR